MLIKHIHLFLILSFVCFGAHGNNKSSSPDNNSTISESTTKQPSNSTSDGKPVTSAQQPLNKKNSQSAAKQPANVRAEDIRPKQPKMAGKYEQLRWPYLLPDEDLEAIANPPDYLMDIQEGSDQDVALGQSLTSPDSDRKPQNAYERALISTKTRPEYNGTWVKIPGFIVPLEFDKDDTITSFFIVPYFGACIHVPPPPPNQIIYVQYPKGLKVDVLYEPFWFYGKLHTVKVANDVATSAYSLTIDKTETFKNTDKY